MNEYQIGAIETVRQLCGTCTRTGSVQKGNCLLEARALSTQETWEARYGLMTASDTIGKGLFRVLDGAVDGKEWKHYELVPGTTRSRSNGAVGKLDCLFDPQPFNTKEHKKKLETERIYIHREECSLQFIGSIFQQSGVSTSNVPTIVRYNDSVTTIAANTDILEELMMYDFHAMAYSIDGNNILGDFTGDSRGVVTKGDVAESTSLSKFHHYDGLIKQALQQHDSTYYAMGEMTLGVPTTGAFFITWAGNVQGCYATATEVVTAINQYCVNVTGDAPFNATLIDAATGKINIIANKVEEQVYGEGALKIFYSENSELAECVDALPFNILQSPMSWSQEPLCFDWRESITCDNFTDYFLDKIKAIMIKCEELNRGSRTLELGNNYIAIDPILYINKNFDELKKLCECDNQEAYFGRINAFMPDFCPVKAMQGTQMWYWTSTDNAIFLTNTEADFLNNFVVGFEQKCDTIWSKFEMLGNALLVDHNKFACNALNSPFHKKLHAPYEPANLPHYCPELRGNCAVKPADSMSGDFKPHGCVTFVCAENDGDDCTLLLDNDSIIPTGDSIDTITWTIYTETGTPTVSVGDDLEVTIPAAACDLLTYVSVTVTTTNGEEGTKVIPQGAFYKDC